MLCAGSGKTAWLEALIREDPCDAAAGPRASAVIARFRQASVLPPLASKAMTPDMFLKAVLLDKGLHSQRFKPDPKTHGPETG